MDDDRRIVHPDQGHYIMSEVSHNSVKTRPTGVRWGTSPIRVIFCADATYFQHLAVTLASMLANSPNSLFLVTIITAKSQAIPRSALAQIASDFGNASLEFREFDLRRVEHLRTNHHITVATYLRLFITEFVDASVSKVLYLDSDLVICRDISALWETDVNAFAVAAVREHPITDRFLDRKISKERYFNAGVLLINLEKWRKAGSPQRLVEFAEKHRDLLELWDQDVLNGVYSDDTLLLDIEWNFQSRMATNTAEQLGIKQEDFVDVCKNPGIVHFSGSTKPWCFNVTVPHMNLYFKYLALTPWRGFTPRESLRNRLLRIFRIKMVKRHVMVKFPKILRILARQ